MAGHCSWNLFSDCGKWDNAMIRGRAQAFTTERNHLPGPIHPLTPLCSVKTLLCENCACVTLPVEKHACTSSVQVLILWCACVVYAHTCFYVVDETAGSRRRSDIVNRNTDLHVCLWKTKQSVVFLSYTPVWPLGGSPCFLYWHNTCPSWTSAAPQKPTALLWNISVLCVAELV